MNSLRAAAPKMTITVGQGWRSLPPLKVLILNIILLFQIKMLLYSPLHSLPPALPVTSHPAVSDPWFFVPYRLKFPVVVTYKYSLLSLYNVACVCMFLGLNLLLDDQSGFPWEELVLPLWACLGYP